jgi:arylsulfatase A-like enzyme
VTVIATWLLLGWLFDRPITQADGSWLVVPYTGSALDAGGDWTQHLYRFGVLGGSEMHAFGGTMPLVELCARLGFSTTTTVNAVTCTIGIALGFFGIRLAEGLASTFRGESVRSSAAQRVVAIWLVSFAPLVGNRLAVGHENLLLGFLPLVVVVSLVWQARAGRASGLALLLGAFAISNGVSGLGAQSVMYSVVFGLPLLGASLWGWRGGRAPLVEIVLVAIAGVLVVMPRLVPMIAHAVGPDATRSLAATVKSSYGAAPASDWLTSIAWSIGDRAPGTIHEHNYPLGPLVLVLALAWPRGTSRRILWVQLAALTIAILYACEVPPVASIVRALPGFEAFRGPSRAAMAVLLFVPPLALACLWARPAVVDKRAWLGVVAAGVLVLLGRDVSPWLREVLAWLAAIAVIVASSTLFSTRWSDQARALAAAMVLAVLGALGVLAFDDRFPRNVPHDTDEGMPAALRAAVAPGLRSSLDRVVVPDAPPPYDMSLALAARMPSIDGVWYPPPRFLALLSALDGKPLPPTTAVFWYSRTRHFPLLQQLYNVRYIVRGLAGAAPTIEELPATPGAAWFPSELVVIDQPEAMLAALSRTNLSATLARSAWVLRGELPAATPPTCRDARVDTVATDAHGQNATFAVSTVSPCTLVVSTNYTSTLAASANGQSLTVFPLDIALTGINVPAGTSRVMLGPVVARPAWAFVLAIVGGLALAALLVVRRLRTRVTSTTALVAIVACAVFAGGCRSSSHEPSQTAGGSGSGGSAAPPPAADAQPPDASVKDGPNVVVILVDTFRADRLGVAGYKRDGGSLTPNLDRFAATATRFTHAYAHAANTPRSFPTIMTSRLPSQITFHKAFHNFPAILDENVMLFEVLAAAGLHTASFSSHFYFEPRRKAGQGVAEYDNAGALDLVAGNADYAAPRIVPKVVARLESLAAERRRFGMFVHLFEPHSTYLDHPEHPVTARGEPGLVARYDYEIATDDAWIGKILDVLDSTKLSERTVVIVLSDHGEAFGLHAFEGQRAFFHGQTLYDEVLRVPLLVRIPGVAASVRDEVVGLVDVAPTIVDALGLPPQPTFSGRSLVPLARGQALEPRDVRAEILPTPDLDDTISALITGDGTEKIITSAKHASTEVYDLRADPDEKKNLAPRDEARTKRLRARLDAPR